SVACGAGSPERREADPMPRGHPPCVATRRMADDVRRVRADVADALGRLGLEGRNVQALGFEDPALVLAPAHRIPPDRAVAPDDAMAGNDERHRVVGERGADGSNGLRVADLGRDPAVRPDLAPRDLERLSPDGGLERGGAAEVELDPRSAV